MWRYFVGGGAALMLALAGMFLFRGAAAPDVKTPPPARAAGVTAANDPLPDEAPSADERTREQKRFDRIDKDKNGEVSRDEFFALRRKLFAKMDTDHDGKLSFDEWAVKGIKRFNDADADKSGTLSRAEFATTAAKRKAGGSRPKCDCRKAEAPPAAKEDGDGEEN